MARDWIKMLIDLREEPEVIQIANETGIDADTVVGKLHRIWGWANKTLRSGNAPGVTFSWIDDYVRTEGFAQAMKNARWLQVRPNGVFFPKFDRHNSQSAKQRALTARRVTRKRNARTVTKSAPRGEESKRRVREGTKVPSETPLPPLPAVLDTQEFRECWASWEKHRKEIKHPLKDTMRSGQIKMLAKLGHDAAVAMIEHTITMGWQGLRAPKDDKKLASPTVDLVAVQKQIDAKKAAKVAGEAK